MPKLFNVKALILFLLLTSAHFAQASSITHTGNPQITGCPDTFTTSLAGTFYQWSFGARAIPTADTGVNAQSASTAFLMSGMHEVYVWVTTSLGIVEDS